MKTRTAVAFAFVAASLLVHPALAQTSYDGLWNVTISTSTGSCEPTTRFLLTVIDGSVSGPGDASGRVGRAGMVRVSMQGAYANGRLNGNAGSGRWNDVSGGLACSGHWEASRN